ncbi:hypothetical protein AB0M95_32830 [Sphaerisporangium sp. NPDC051017]|uniref:hypothetical protein n=1 Tax=Sphaerisporangium sp. NPDC051017 TaxID=3154636 RepID=UPI00342D5605
MAVVSVRPVAEPAGQGWLQVFELVLAACGSRNDRRGWVARLIKGFASGRAIIVALVSEPT